MTPPAEVPKSCLLDTSTFYWCWSPEAQRRLNAAADGARMTTSISSVFEILAGIRNQNFAERQHALGAVVQICGKDGLLAPQPDAVVARAFGLDDEPLPVDVAWEGLQAGLQAADAAELATAVEDLTARLRRSVDIQRLRLWDSQTGQFFSTQVGTQYARVDPKLKTMAREAGFERHDAAQVARLLRAVQITENPLSRRLALLGLAARGGLVPEAELAALLAPGVPEQEALRGLEELYDRAESVYDRSLDGFIEVYVHYHGYLAATGRTGGQNDCLDLDPFVYFSVSDRAQKYVSGEDMWLKIVRLVDPHRSIDAKACAAPDVPGAK